MEDRVQGLQLGAGDSGPALALGVASLGIGAGILAAWLVHRRCGGQGRWACMGVGTGRRRFQP